MSSEGNLESLGAKDRETHIIDSVRRELSDAAGEKRYGETNFRLTFVDGRPKILEVTGKTSYKFE